MYEEELDKADKREFSLFEFVQSAGRDRAMKFVFIRSLMQYHLDVYINDRKMALFLDKIYEGYRRDVQYHNDLHGADVAQMAYLFLH